MEQQSTGASLLNLSGKVALLIGGGGEGIGGAHRRGALGSGRRRGDRRPFR
jgi:hypothetical protein